MKHNMYMTLTAYKYLTFTARSNTCKATNIMLLWLGKETCRAFFCLFVGHTFSLEVALNCQSYCRIHVLVDLLRTRKYSGVALSSVGEYIFVHIFPLWCFMYSHDSNISTWLSSLNNFFFSWNIKNFRITTYSLSLIINDNCCRYGKVYWCQMVVCTTDLHFMLEWPLLHCVLEHPHVL